MTPQEARALVAALPGAREHWLAKTVESAQARAVWLTGSLGRGQADEWSDVDLIVVDGSPLLDDALVTTDNPATALSAAATSASCMTSVR
jgi:predicted nucleotidyltransferase